MLSHLFESTTLPIITKIIQFCYLTFLAAGRWRDRPSSIADAKPAIALLEGVKTCDRSFQPKMAIAQHNIVKQYFKQRERLTIENYC